MTNQWFVVRRTDFKYFREMGLYLEKTHFPDIITPYCLYGLDM